MSEWFKRLSGVLQGSASIIYDGQRFFAFRRMVAASGQVGNNVFVGDVCSSYAFPARIVLWVLRKFPKSRRSLRKCVLPINGRTQMKFSFTKNFLQRFLENGLVIVADPPEDFNHQVFFYGCKDGFDRRWF